MSRCARRDRHEKETFPKDDLHITYPLMMTDYNRQTVLQKPSRFVTECPPEMFETWNLEEEPL